MSASLTDRKPPQSGSLLFLLVLIFAVHRAEQFTILMAAAGFVYLWRTRPKLQMEGLDAIALLKIVAVLAVATATGLCCACAFERGNPFHK